jgi:hypothetical protein
MGLFLFPRLPFWLIIPDAALAAAAAAAAPWAANMAAIAIVMLLADEFVIGDVVVVDDEPVSGWVVDDVKSYGRKRLIRLCRRHLARLFENQT